MSNDMILIIGVTASGKGQVAFRLAQELQAEIISVDSMKVYRRMDIGTSKPPIEARRQIKYHLIDVVEPSESFNVAAFLRLAQESIEKIKNTGKPVIAVGGTALYIKALLYGLFEGPGANNEIRIKLRTKAEKDGLKSLYHQLAAIDPEAADKIHPNDAKRIIRALEIYELTNKPISSFQNQFDNDVSTETPFHNWTIIGLRREKHIESQQINGRVKKMIEEGLVDEVKSLLAEDKPLSQQAACAIGYAEIISYLNGQTTLEDAIELIKKNSRYLAKHQRTWFKRFKNVNWLDIQADEPILQTLERIKTMLRVN